MRSTWSFTMIELHCSLDGTDFTLVGGGDFSPVLPGSECANQQEYTIAQTDAVACRFVKLLFSINRDLYQSISGVGLSMVEIYGTHSRDCVESTADASTCTAIGQELYTLTMSAANGGAACTGSSTLCVAGDGTIPRDCDEITLHPNYCTAIGQELYTLTMSAANGGAACTGSSTLCVAGDGTIPRDCVESTADASTCTAIGQDLYTLTTPTANGGAACTGSSTLCVAGDGSIPAPTICEICAECEVCATPVPAPCPSGSSGRRRQLQPVEAAQSLVPFLAPLLAVIGIVARFQ
jgi:hypothetical protein